MLPSYFRGGQHCAIDEQNAFPTPCLAETAGCIPLPHCRLNELIDLGGFRCCQHQVQACRIAKDLVAKYDS